jgi:hypothetical protein
MIAQKLIDSVVNFLRDLQDFTRYPSTRFSGSAFELRKLSQLNGIGLYRLKIIYFGQVTQSGASPHKHRKDPAMIGWSQKVSERTLVRGGGKVHLILEEFILAVAPTPTKSRRFASLFSEWQPEIPQQNLVKD